MGCQGSNPARMCKANALPAVLSPRFTIFSTRASFFTFCIFMAVLLSVLYNCMTISLSGCITIVCIFMTVLLC